MTSEAYSAEPAPLRAGGIVLRRRGRSVLTARVHRPRHDDWSFPKGKVDAGESPEQTALREVWEETALRCRLGRYLGLVTHGLTDGTDKPTHYWVMEVVGADPFVPGEEIDELRWVELGVAARLLTHPRDRALVRAVSVGLPG